MLYVCECSVCGALNVAGSGGGGSKDQDQDIRKCQLVLVSASDQWTMVQTYGLLARIHWLALWSHCGQHYLHEVK